MAQHGQESDFHAAYQYHRREWMAQRVGWIVMVLVLVAALAGLFGRGPLSHVQAQGEQFQVSYQRFARHGAPTEIVIQSSGAAAHDGLAVQVAHSFIDAYNIEAVIPEPSRTSSTDEAIRFHFDSAGATTKVTFRLEPDEFGTHAGAVQVGAGEGLLISQFVYP